MPLLQLLGRGLAQLPRDQIYVATKVGKYRAGEPEDFSGERVKRSVHESLQRLGEWPASRGAQHTQMHMQLNVVEEARRG
jgi:Aldo/keto reductase family